MKTLLNIDWDETVVHSEEAKAMTWLFAALRLLGLIDEFLVNDVKGGGRINEAKQILESHADKLRAIQDLKGLSRSATALGVCKGLLLPTTPEELAEFRNETRRPLLEALTRPIKGAVDFLEIGYAKGLTLAVVTQTTSEDIERQIERFDIPRVFSTLACAGDPRFRTDQGDAKATAHQRVCRQFSLPPSSVVAIDDSEAGIQSARSIGMPTIAVTCSPDKRVPAADLNVHPDLGSLARDDVVELLANEPPHQSLREIRMLLGDKAS